MPFSTPQTGSLLSRRQVLRGLGVTMALPWLESISLAGNQAGSGPVNRPPKRFAYCYTAHGYYLPDFWARGQGDAMQLGSLLTPLEPFRRDLLFLKGFGHRNQQLFGNDHSGYMPQTLSGCRLLLSPSEVRAAMTFDQVMARAFERETEIPSLVLGVDRARPGVHGLCPAWYTSHVSWSSPTAVARRIIDPKEAFDSLFIDHRARSRLDQSVLDLVNEDARSLQARANAADRRRLEEFFTAVRESERRVEWLERLQRREGWRPSVVRADMPRPELDGPGRALSPPEPERNMRAMLDIVALAFRMDKTRVATVMLDDDHNWTHQISHDGAAPSQPRAKIDEWCAILRTRFELFAAFCRQLAEHNEGGERLLDNAIVGVGSNVSHNHDVSYLPAVWVGRGGGLQSGKALDDTGRSDEERKMCRVYLSIMHRMGVRADSFGDATTPHSEI